LERFRWIADNYGGYTLSVYGIRLSIEPLPSHSPRGHFWGNIEGLPAISAADGFPRFYMKLQRGKNDLREWLLWRLNCLEQSDPKAFEALKRRA